MFRASVRLVPLAALLAACGPSIKAFDVRPGKACPGQQVAITFDVKGTPRLYTTLSMGDAADTTRYLLVVTRGQGVTQATRDVETFRAGASIPLAWVTAPLGRDSVAAADALPAARWPAPVRIAGVSARGDRPVRVRHGGRDVLLDPSAPPSRALDDLPVAGSWQLAAGLLAGEAMGVPDRAPPERLGLAVGIACGSEGGAP
ncbi:MAG: hypothetical protein ACOY71_11700 [Gemmatimonadota bacterium]